MQTLVISLVKMYRGPILANSANAVPLALAISCRFSDDEVVVSRPRTSPHGGRGV